MNLETESGSYSRLRVLQATEMPDGLTMFLPTWCGLEWNAVSYYRCTLTAH
jgi:hypothetical protein